VVEVAFSSVRGMERWRERLVKKVNERFPSEDPRATVEVDVVGISLGGEVARYAALERDDGGRRLRVRNLYAIGTAVSGPALESVWETIDAARTTDVDARTVGYWRLGDTEVAFAAAAPAGRPVWWAPTGSLEPVHVMGFSDVRFLADIARRLRHETPLGTEPA